MAFDSVFQGPPSDVAAPGTAQSPSLGIDVTEQSSPRVSGWFMVGKKLQAVW